MQKRILRLPEVIEKVGQSRSTIYASVRDGTFPQPVNLSKRLIGWRESDIDDYIDALAGKSQAAA